MAALQAVQGAAACPAVEPGFTPAGWQVQRRVREGARRSAPWGGRAHFGDGRFTGEHFAHRDFSLRFSRFADRDDFHRRFFDHRFDHRFDHGFFHHRFHRFAFVDDGGCWRRIWTPRGPRLVNICG
ncbi:hypothetical protein [Bradyrhizobium sp. CB1650]|uniref:hypothetical protein n=1 Tax=Bradyrhizobium sp. CB1650 TaxID=3039153 RepID=UPI00325FA44E